MNDYTDLISSAKESLTSTKRWNRSQVDRWVKALFGPLGRTWGNDASTVFVGIERNGQRMRLGSGHAVNGAGAYKNAFINTFIKPLEAREKARQMKLEESAALNEKAKALAAEMKAKHEATVNNPASSPEQVEEATQALATYRRTQGMD